MTDDGVTLRIEINSRIMAWLFLVLGMGAVVVGGLTFDSSQPWYVALGITLVGLAFGAVTFLLRERALFTFDRTAGTLRWQRSSWLGIWRKTGEVPLDTIRRARVVGVGGHGGNSATFRCVLDQDPGFIPLTRGEDGNERIHVERAERIQAWLDAGRT